MGLVISSIEEVLQSFDDKDARILMLGLDGAGKTTILQKLKYKGTVSSLPTIGFNVETVAPVEGISFTVWDLGGDDKIKQLWRRFFQGTNGLIFVIDSTDLARMDMACQELWKVLADEEMMGVDVIILANKQDVPGAMSLENIVDALQLPKLDNRWHIEATCATTGKGIYEAMNVLARFVQGEPQEEEEEDSFWPW